MKHDRRSSCSTKTLRLLCIATMTVGLALSLAPTRPAQAATFTVTKTADTNDGACNADCSLREAIVAANAPGADSIILPAGTYTLTIAGAGEDGALTGDLDITSDLTLTGAGADVTTINGGGLGER
jgi:CSLREA domain-containing protein